MEAFVPLMNRLLKNMLDNIASLRENFKPACGGQLLLLMSMGFSGLGFSISAQADCDFDDFPIMSAMKFFPLLADASFNNRPMMVKGYTSDDSLEEVAGYYHRQWKGRVDDSTIGPWFQVSSLQDECMMTVQIARQNDGTQGRLVISNIPEIAGDAEIGEGLLMPGDAVVVSDLSTKDGPKKGRVSVLASAGSSSEVAAFYLANMDQAGWRLEHSFNQDGAQVLVFRDGLNTSNILIIPAADITQILINEERVD